MSDQYVIYLKQCFLSLTYKKDNSLSGSFCRISCNLLHTKTVSSHSFCQVWYTYLAVKGFRSEKGMRSAVGFLWKASFAALSATSFPRIPACPGTHIKTISFWSALILCNRYCICISRGWSVLIFPSACKADSESEKKTWISFLGTDVLD